MKLNIREILMNELVNSPCISSLAPSCVKSAMGSSFDDGEMAAPFTEDVSKSVEEELVSDEDASAVTLAPNLCVVPDLSVVVQGGEECLRGFMDHLSGEERLRVIFYWEESLMIKIVSWIS